MHRSMSAVTNATRTVNSAQTVQANIKIKVAIHYSNMSISVASGPKAMRLVPSLATWDCSWADKVPSESVTTGRASRYKPRTEPKPMPSSWQSVSAVALMSTTWGWCSAWVCAVCLVLFALRRQGKRREKFAAFFHFDNYTQLLMLWYVSS